MHELLVILLQYLPTVKQSIIVVSNESNPQVKEQKNYNQYTQTAILNHRKRTLDTFMLAFKSP